jgi:hypothetical protein
MKPRVAASFLLASVILASIPSIAGATTMNRLSVGDRVRVTARAIDPKPMVGRIVYADPLQFTIALDGADSAATRGVPWESLNALERSEGRRSNVGKGAALGGLAAFVGTVAAFGIGDQGTNDLGGGAALGGIVLFSAAGAAIGAGIGALTHSEHWTSLPIDSRVGLQLGAPSMPLALGIRASF